jgi:hypothetical protein
MGKGLSEDELKALIDGELRQSVGYFGGRLANSRQKALQYFEALPVGDLAPPEVEGRSRVVVPVVRTITLSVLASLMEKFASGENIVECEARRPEDEESAKIATEYLNNLFIKQNQGHRVLETAILDSLISKTGTVKVWFDTRVIESKEDYRGLTDVELAEILDDEEVEAITHDQYPDEEAAEQKAKILENIQAQLAQAQQSTDPQAIQALQQHLMQASQMPVPNLHDISVKRSKKGGRIQIESVPPEELMVSRKMKSLDPDREPQFFVAHRVIRSASELQSMGVKDVDQITSDDNQNMWSMERVERLTWDDDMAYLTQTETPSYDESQRAIVLTECYLKCDYDGDGISELRCVIKAGNTIISNEEVDAVPFAILRPIHMPHRFFGLSYADLAMESQRVETVLWRNILDNRALSTNKRYWVVEGQVNLDDALTSRPGSLIRVRTPQAIGELGDGGGDISNAGEIMSLTRQQTEDSTGWSLTAQVADDPNSINLTATAANLASNKANQRTDMVARNIAEGVKDIFKLMLKLVCQHQDKIENIKLGGRWMSIDPRTWKNQFDLNLAVGLGTGSKDQQVNGMQLMMQHMGAQIQSGMPTVTPQNVYNASKKLAEALGYKNSDAFFTDPSKAPQQQKPDPEMMKIQVQQQMEGQKLQAQMQLEREKAQIEVQKIMQEQQAQAAEREKELQLEAQRNALQAQHEAQLAQMKADQDARIRDQEMAFNEWKAKLEAETKIVTAKIAAGAKGTELGDEPSSEEIQSQAVLAAMQGLTQAIQGMTMAHAAPKKLVVNPDGSKMVVPVQ